MIEGENETYLIDDQGNIYDFNANFVGTTNPQLQPHCHQQVGTNELDSGSDLDPTMQDDFHPRRW